MSVHTSVFIIGIAAAMTCHARAQTPPDQVSAAARPDFSGRWSLDRSISSDPARADFDPPRDNRSRRADAFGGGFGGGTRRRGSSSGFGGARPDNQDTAAASTPDEPATRQLVLRVRRDITEVQRGVGPELKLVAASYGGRGWRLGLGVGG